jgi:hypothetical protein
MSHNDLKLLTKGLSNAGLRDAIIVWVPATVVEGRVLRYIVD